MKLILIGLTLLFTLSLSVAAQVNETTQSKPVNSIEQRGTSTVESEKSMSPSSRGPHSGVMSRAEAESLRAQESRVLAQSDIGDIKVGSVGDSDLVYILVVVLLVVVIISVL